MKIALLREVKQYEYRVARSPAKLLAAAAEKKNLP
jgi:alanine dehydrogenase